MLNINILKDGGKAIFALEGRLDTSTAPQLEEAINRDIEKITDLSFDFANLEYISNVSEEVMEIFDVTGFSDILTIG